MLVGKASLILAVVSLGFVGKDSADAIDLLGVGFFFEFSS